MNKTVKKLIKIGVFISAIAGTMYAINRYIEKAANVLNKLNSNNNSYYKWRFGNIYYEKTGEGSPILLIHDFTPYASSYEWKNIVTSLAKNHTVYTIDLLGCGRSDKPSITYTNFIYVQMITDFINDVIGEKTDIITSGHASSFAIMSTNYTCKNINNLLLINPTDLDISTKILSKYSKLVKTILEIPVLGTFLYNMMTLRKNIQSILTEKYFYDPSFADNDFVDTYYEAAHRNHHNSKYVMASMIGNYMEANIFQGLNNCENSIFIIGGEDHENIETTIGLYKELKPEIISSIIESSKKLPHYEVPEQVLNKIKEYID